MSFWQPRCKPGYVALGDFCQKGTNKPSKYSSMMCVRKNLTKKCDKTKVFKYYSQRESKYILAYKSSDILVQGLITTDRQAYCLK